ncbi:TPA: FtsX-like permease family protein [Streptococcus suis]|nr:FtsX-like permease family protein [Streptococcus suis]
MVQLIFYQFKFRKREWAGAVPLLFTSGILVGTCLTLLFNILENIKLFHKEVPWPLFTAPIFFGGITLLFLLSSIVHYLFNIFKKEYKQWMILGADRGQLSILAGGQLAIITCISSLFGALLSIIVSKGYYSLIQEQIGKEYFPVIDMRFNLLAVCLTIFLLSILSFFGGTYATYKIIGRNNFFEETNQTKKRLSKLVKSIVIVINLFLWLSLVIGSIIVPYLDLPGGMEYKLAFQSSAIFYLLIIHIIFLNYLSPNLEIRLIQFLSRKSRSFSIVFSKWNIIQNKHFLSSITLSLVTAISFTAGLLMISNNSIRSSFEQSKEVFASFLFYLAGPLVLIISNIVTLTIISSKQEKDLTSQLEILGVSKLQLIKLRCGESLMNSLVIFIVSLILNLIIAVLVLNITFHTNLITLDYSLIFCPALIISLFYWLLVITTKFFIKFGNSRKK